MRMSGHLRHESAAATTKASATTKELILAVVRELGASDVLADGSEIPELVARDTNQCDYAPGKGQRTLAG